MSTFRSILFMFFLITTFIHSSLHANATTNLPSSIKLSIKELSSARPGSELLLRKYPELFWLISNASENSSSQQANAPLDKALNGLFQIRNFLDGSKNAYQRFTSLQEEAQKLSFRQYKQIHILFRDFILENPALKPEDALRVLDTAFIIAKISEGKKTASVFSPFFSITDEETFYKKALAVLHKFPTLCPTFGRLPKNCQNAILASKQLLPLSDPNSLQDCRKLLLHAEKIDLAGDNSLSSNLRTLLYFLNVSTTGLQNELLSSKSYTDPVHKNFISLLSSIQAMKKNGMNGEQAFSLCFHQRAQSLGLNSSDSGDRVLAQLCSALQIHDAKESSALKAAFKDFSNETVASAIAHLDPFLIGWDSPLSSSAVSFLASLYHKEKSSKASNDINLYNAIKNGLPLLLKAFSLHETMIASHMISGKTDLKFDFAADFALALEDLSVLELSDVQITNKGYVLIKPTSDMTIT
ncbi:hypothetical protein CLAVI_000138 [Candidatus Clavichlamydia salmonicola]|uniref:hypothetical protein n=1 Tax=Candidatus Clavichlamydia salmonicola TaxID=469812 RepID=UPI001891500F|nr:hypothetical protein [Candidatus Clavichlamydia salmonicola]MBF5050528.1 hypothetical protein [Candidatus Clavichlamydia salmonicola]